MIDVLINFLKTLVIRKTRNRTRVSTVGGARKETLRIEMEGYIELVEQ